ncbi:GNAT family N-acetyltransferase [Kitasatospora cheerisanensis]|uniref:Putative acetyltransferase n=1 Tax=Kitasatospora cheerisanensis KCTC 2395 TaxID=1348663 RepID=A0A066Z4Y3_9ACTN|nr:GNAT family N-acetyltransferase [Kitasatospora cheerisanensis]KDN87304.1 putative acetyltransferase [Kitasatospora cheerisanensis KCTC 2395]
MDDVEQFAAATELAEWGPAEIRALAGGADDPFGTGPLGGTWRPKDRHFGVRHEGRVVAHAGFVVVPVEVGGQRFEVAGLGGVLVDPALRGRGLARIAVTGALNAARADGLDRALLFCFPDRSPLYARLGWHALPEAVTADQPDGPAPVPLGAMWKPLSPGVAWPAGPVRLRSLPM